MEKFKIYHNPKCSKSRQALELLKSRNIELEIIEYLKNPLTKDELLSLLNILKNDLHEVIRSKDDDFKASPFDLSSREVIVENLLRLPKLMERPIIVKDEKVAIIARPMERLEELFS